MALKPRVEYAGAVYHVLACRNERARIFIEAEDAQMFLEALDRGEAKVEVARDLGYWDGENVLQILKRIKARCQKDKEWKRKHEKYSQHLSRAGD